MTALSITANLELDPWTDLLPALESGDLVHGLIDGVGILPAGMASGLASVSFRGPTDDGKPFHVEISWAMLHAAFHALAATPTIQMEGM